MSTVCPWGPRVQLRGNATSGHHSHRANSTFLFHRPPNPLFLSSFPTSPVLALLICPCLRSVLISSSSPASHVVQQQWQWEELPLRGREGSVLVLNAKFPAWHDESPPSRREGCVRTLQLLSPGSGPSITGRCSPGRKTGLFQQLVRKPCCFRLAWSTLSLFSF